jgi:hypothetical protein
MSSEIEGKRLIPLFEDKVQVKVYLPKSLAKKLRELIFQKYGSYKGGLLSYEVEEAVRRYISAHTNVTQIPKGSNPIPKIHIVKEQIKEYLRQKYGYLMTNQVLTKHFEEAIINLRGADPRTKDKWVKALIAAGVLKILGPYQVELI